MGNPLTKEMLLRLAAKSNSLQAVRQSADFSLWQNLGTDGQCLWGDCAGAEAIPYRVFAYSDVSAYRCICPSRKKPCRHVLALLELFLTDSDAFISSALPSDVEEWKQQLLNKEKRKKKTPSFPLPPKSQDPPTQDLEVFSLTPRASNILEGMQLLTFWLDDRLRMGLASLLNNKKGLEEMGRRLIDAQAPAMARRLLAVAALPNNAQWAAAVCQCLSNIYLLADSWTHIDDLPPLWQTELCTQMGIPQKSAQVLASAGVSDLWKVLYTYTCKEDKMTVIRYWLWGRASHRMAFYVCYFPSFKTIDASLLLTLGRCYQGTLHFYEGLTPLRVCLDADFLLSADNFIPQGFALSAAAAYFRKQVSVNPFLEQVPLVIDAVELGSTADHRWIFLSDGSSLEVIVSRQLLPNLLSTARVGKFSAFCLADGFTLHILSFWNADSFFYDEAGVV